MQLLRLSKLAAVAFAALSAAHPGEHEEHDAATALAKREFRSNARRSLNKCADKFEARGLNARAVARRQAAVAKHKKRHVIRDTDAIVNKTHHSDLTGITPQNGEDIVFATNNTCILAPEGEIGPFWVKGEHIRSDVREGQAGIPIVVEGQFVDVETCEPLEGVYWDLWNCNATGVYSGATGSGNGNSADTANVNTTFLRGLQKTDADGVATFESVFPGHYSGRATHHHMVVFTNATVLPNNTLTGGNAAHIGQIFWDQDLIYEIEATAPYNTNDVDITTNAEDHVVIAETENSDSDPFLEYVYLGDSLEEGLFAWITVAVNTSASYETSYSFEYTEDGGVAVDNGNSFSPGDGAAPSGSGAAPSGAAATPA
ncbi:uncharacterized protein K452DRAFT_321813 [Aplosporella prunicola CBS 121167]|uniref:Intradiol ring-cleavage dioxygenases domain-containing protein n=1 Tax=Aplosporella prunicola CBS 121167 TaxID=1176127 RepID=A0A6A6B1Z7_9PEZI|nr:uncharacterized protein K452DRAFT_321813 [Aplosporella prunicola CBS 121167]KAF2137393.1 hypothetical protein K452DRAFT_321813 [Aplosporella prunicola CBS 121167]